MVFFDSRIESDVINGQYFITSEQYDDDSPRLFTIRRANDDGIIDTVDEFQGYVSRESAWRAIPAE